MNANQKQNKVDAAIDSMMELAEENDVCGIEDANEEGYEYARGSNSRKDELERGYRAALKIVEANKAAEKAAKIEAEEAAKVEVIEATPQTEKIDAQKVANFPTAYARDHFVFVAHPAGKMTDAERDAYVAANVIAPEGWQVVTTIATRRESGSDDWYIRIHYTPGVAKKAELQENLQKAFARIASGENSPKVILTLASANDSPVVEIARADDNFYRRTLLPDGTKAGRGGSNWQLIGAEEIGQIITSPIDTPVKEAIITSLHRRQIRKRGGGKPRIETDNPATLYQRERRAKLKDQQESDHAHRDFQGNPQPCEKPKLECDMWHSTVWEKMREYESENPEDYIGEAHR